MSAHTLGPLLFLCVSEFVYWCKRARERNVWVGVRGVFPFFFLLFCVCVCVYVECLTQNHNNLAIILEFSVTHKQLIPALPE